MDKTKIEIKQALFLRCIEFKPLLTPKQYKVYVKHIEWVIDELRKVEEVGR